MNKIKVWLGAVAIVGISGNALAVDETGGLVFDTVIFSENFDAYQADRVLPRGKVWKSVSSNEEKDCVVLVRADENNIFGVAGNKYLQIDDNSTDMAARVLAKNVPGFSSKLFRMSFDFYEPDNSKTGAFGFRAGVDSVAKSDETVVNGVQLSDGKSRPGADYSLGQKHHVDLYINETGERVSYMAPDGSSMRLKSENCAVWIDGICVAKGADIQRSLKESVAATGFKLETYSSSKQEVWVDNIEIAVAQ